MHTGILFINMHICIIYYMHMHTSTVYAYNIYAYMHIIDMHNIMCAYKYAHAYIYVFCAVAGVINFVKFVLLAPPRIWWIANYCCILHLELYYYNMHKNNIIRCAFLPSALTKCPYQVISTCFFLLCPVTCCRTQQRLQSCQCRRAL